MSDLYDVFDSQEGKVNNQSYNPEKWKAQQKQNRQFCYDTIEQELARIREDPQTFRRYLDLQSRLTLYSPRNILLIAVQKGSASKLADRKTWQERGVAIQPGQQNFPVLILEPGKQYEKADGTEGQYFNAKKLYDVSQTTAEQTSEPIKRLEGRMLIKTLITGAPVRILASDDQSEMEGAKYLSKENCITVCRGLDAPQLFECLSRELAAAEYIHMKGLRIDPVFASRCASYMLCKQADIDIGRFSFADATDHFTGKEPQDVAKLLTQIRQGFLPVSERVSQNRYQLLDKQREPIDGR